jgi:hypothetical protein
MTRTSNHCYIEFVANGGLRILKRWIKTAEIDGNVEELRVLVKLCEKLPFDSHAVKVTEIGKTIKKLLKFTASDAAAGGSDGSTSLLHGEVRDLMTHWMKQANLAAASAPVVIARDIAQIESKVSEVVDDTPVGSVPVEIDEDKPPAVLVHINRVTPEVTFVSPSITTTTTPTPFVGGAPVVFPKLNIIRVSEMAPSTSQLAPSNVLLSVNRSAIAGVSRSTRKPTDMAEGARKLLAMRAQAQTDGSGAKDAAAPDSVVEVLMSYFV